MKYDPILKIFWRIAELEARALGSLIIVQLKNDTIMLRQLMHFMFELNFLDVSDMRWRGETQTRSR